MENVEGNEIHVFDWRKKRNFDGIKQKSNEDISLESTIPSSSNDVEVKRFCTLRCSVTEEPQMWDSIEKKECEETLLSLIDKKQVEWNT